MQTSPIAPDSTFKSLAHKIANRIEGSLLGRAAIWIYQGQIAISRNILKAGTLALSTLVLATSSLGLFATQKVRKISLTPVALALRQKIGALFDRVKIKPGVPFVISGEKLNEEELIGKLKQGDLLAINLDQLISLKIHPRGSSSHPELGDQLFRYQSTGGQHLIQRVDHTMSEHDRCEFLSHIQFTIHTLSDDILEKKEKVVGGVPIQSSDLRAASLTLIHGLNEQPQNIFEIINTGVLFPSAGCLNSPDKMLESTWLQHSLPSKNTSPEQEERIKQALYHTRVHVNWFSNDWDNSYQKHLAIWWDIDEKKLEQLEKSNPAKVSLFAKESHFIMAQPLPLKMARAIVVRKELPDAEDFKSKIEQALLDKGLSDIKVIFASKPQQL